MARTKRAKQMRFSAAHAREAAFHDGGLRSCFEYRDLGIAKATGGRARNEAMASLVWVKIGKVSDVANDTSLTPKADLRPARL